MWGRHQPPQILLSRNGRFNNVAPLSESDSKGNRKVFMVGQNDALGDQTKEEITQTIAVKITRSKMLVRETEKVAGKMHMSP
jgi:hypothetical protein